MTTTTTIRIADDLKARLAVVAALVLSFEKDTLENQGRVHEVRAWSSRLPRLFLLIPLGAHHS